MHALWLERMGPIQTGSRPLRLTDVAVPKPAAGEVLLQIAACGVCHTELDEIEGRLPPPRLPVILGHQIVGWVAAIGEGVEQWKAGDRAGLAWIYSACGTCEFCGNQQENLCPQFQGTGRDRHGGYAEFTVAQADFLVPIPKAFTDTQAAPLLCAGAIGYRSLRLTNLDNGQRLGLTGFGASAQLVLQMARHRFPASEFFVFARSPEERKLALSQGAVWAGDTRESAPQPLHAIIDTTPAWLPIVAALKNLQAGGRLVVNAIRKEETDKPALASLHYAEHLWLEKEIKSVANVTRRDVAEFLALAADMRLQPQVQEYALAEANAALVDLKTRPVLGAKVLVCAS